MLLKDSYEEESKFKFFLHQQILIHINYILNISGAAI